MRHTQIYRIHVHTHTITTHQMTDFAFVDAAVAWDSVVLLPYTTTSTLIYLCSPFSFFFYFFLSLLLLLHIFFMFPHQMFLMHTTMEWNDYTPNGFDRKKKLTRKKNRTEYECCYETHHQITTKKWNNVPIHINLALK